MFYTKLPGFAGPAAFKGTATCYCGGTVIIQSTIRFCPDCGLPKADGRCDHCDVEYDADLVICCEP